MKKMNTRIFLFGTTILFALHSNAGIKIGNKSSGSPNGFDTKSKDEVRFTENKGQIHDQYYHAQSDILFGGTDGNLVFHLKTRGVSYQLNRVDSWKEVVDELSQKKRKEIDKSTIYRLDINWLNANTNATILKGKSFSDIDNYYSESCPNGALNVHHYEDLTYKNIYDGINLKWYQKEGHLKYDYIVSARANYKSIKLQFSGATSIALNSKGELVISTPLGNIIEQAPLVIQNKKVLKAKWIIKNNTVSFDIDNLNPNLSFVIDPAIRTWGTYYGGAGYDIGTSCSIDASDNVYLSGNSDANSGVVIATVGSHQSTLSGDRDAYIVKFNPSGVRQWGTYYGGARFELASSCAADASGNVYLLGTTQTSVGITIASAGSHQSTYGGGASTSTDAFLVKFNASGVRQWGTYYGGIGTEAGNSCSLDANGNVYITGQTSASTSSTAISTVGSHQSTYGGDTYDAFLVKFDANGVRQWGTYYGGSGIDYGQTCCVDASGSIYLGGYTASNSGTVIATPGSHQSSHGGSTYDAFLVKFNISGVRQWGTYYGGTGYDDGYSCSIDASGNIYLSGTTTSSSGTVIASAGSHQATFGGGSSADAYLVKFNASGVRQWGTYYGGSDVGDDRGYSCATDANGNIFLTGKTTCSTSSIISTTGSHQTIFGGGLSNAFLVKFNAGGVRQWGTYYGGSGTDYGQTCCADASGSIYLGGYGQSNSGTAIASSGSHQSTYGGGAYDAFLVKFLDCSAPSNPSGSDQVICENTTATLTATSASATINWYSTPSSTVVISTGTTYITPTLSVGSYTYYADATTCTVSATRTAITVTVNALPTISVNSGSICSGSSFTINPTGANTYTISGGSAVVSPTSNTTYSISGTNAEGCVSLNPAVSSITVNPLPNVTAISNSSLMCTGQTASLTANGASTYLWNTSATTSVIAISPTVTTNYTVTGTDLNGCSNTAILTQSVDACTGINSLNAYNTHVIIYPNPSNGLFIIAGIESNTNISIYNAIGKLVKSIQSTDKNTIVDLSDYSNGIYFIKIQNNKGDAIQKLIKQ